MKIELDTGMLQFAVRAYSDHSVTVNSQELRRSFLLMPDQLISDWPPQRLAEISSSHIEQIAALRPEIVILGTGRQLGFPAAVILQPLVERGIGHEIMDTRAACRCYTILASEGRCVLAAMLPPDAV